MTRLSLHLTIALFAAVFAAVLPLVPAAQAQVPETIAYQGYLTNADGVPLVDDGATLTFRIYDALTGGTAQWEETHILVNIRDGVFAVELGAVAALPPSLFSAPQFLSVAVGGTSAEELSPRVPLAAVPYSLRAAQLDPAALKAGTNVTIAPDADGALVITADGGGSSGTAWQLGGNASTDPAADFVGTTDDTPLEVRVNDERVMRYEPTPPDVGPNVVGGWSGNSMGADVIGGTVAGGGAFSSSTFLGPNAVHANYGTVGGGVNNEASSRYATVGGGIGNVAGNGASNVLADANTVAGGQGNTASGHRSTVAGGLNNEASSSGSTVGGGASNTASGLGAVVGGGGANTASGNGATIGGGDNNTAGGKHATVGGGWENVAGAEESTIGGGRANLAGGKKAAIGGGSLNVAAADHATVSGGNNNRGSGLGAVVGGGFSNTASGASATIGGGQGNTAGGVFATVPGGNDNQALASSSFAAGQRATVRAGDHGTFVWADSEFADFTSTGEDQFLVRAAGGVGLGTNAPLSQLHVAEAINGSASLGNHVALIENTSESTSNGPDVLALKTSAAGPNGATNFISFFDGANASVGAIEGNGSGGVVYKTTGGDFAEMLPRLNAAESITPGDVVGVIGGRITRQTDGATQVLVVTDRPAVLGNAHASDKTAHPVAFVGQVPVRVRGPVAVGDFIVPSGEADGTALAIAPEAMALADHAQIVGRAWGAAPAGGVHAVTVAVGLDRVGALVEQLMRHQADLDALRQRQARWETRLRAQQAQIEALRARLNALGNESQ